MVRVFWYKWEILRAKGNTSTAESPSGW